MAMTVKYGIGMLGDAAVLLLVVAPIWLVFIPMRQAHHVGDRTVLPYATTWMNAAAFAFYGYNRHDWPVAGVNAVAFVFETLYCGVYIYYAQAGWRRKHAIGVAAFQAAFIAILACLQSTVFNHGRHPYARDRTYGILGLLTAVAMYLSTIDRTYHANRTHDVADLNTSFPYLFNALVWLVYSAIRPLDPFVLVASIVGLLSNGYQAFLWIRYRNAPILPPAGAAGGGAGVHGAAGGGAGVHGAAGGGAGVHGAAGGGHIRQPVIRPPSVVRAAAGGARVDGAAGGGDIRLSVIRPPAVVRAAGGGDNRPPAVPLPSVDGAGGGGDNHLPVLAPPSVVGGAGGGSARGASADDQSRLPAISQAGGDAPDGQSTVSQASGASLDEGQTRMPVIPHTPTSGDAAGAHEKAHAE